MAGERNSASHQRELTGCLTDDYRSECICRFRLTTQWSQPDSPVDGARLGLKGPKSDIMEHAAVHEGHSVMHAVSWPVSSQVAIQLTISRPVNATVDRTVLLQNVHTLLLMMIGVCEAFLNRPPPDAPLPVLHIGSIYQSLLNMRCWMCPMTNYVDYVTR